MDTTPPCECYDRLPSGSTRQELGVDVTNGRYGDVSVSTCSLCGRRWLFYSAEFEGFRASQRWIYGILPGTQEVPFPPEEAVPIFNRMPWFIYHLSGDPERCGKGDAPADMGVYPELVSIDYATEATNGIPVNRSGDDESTTDSYE